MSLFKRTVGDVDDLQASVSALSSSTEPIHARKQSLADVQTRLSQLQPVVDKFVFKADQGEKDPNKRTYGPSMVDKIRQLSANISGLVVQIDDLAANIDAQYAECEKQLALQREKQREEEERLKREQQLRMEQERLEQEQRAKALEEQRKKEEQLRLQKEQQEKQAALLRAQEEAKRQQLQRMLKEKEHAEQKANEQKLLREKQAAEEAKRLEEQKQPQAEAAKGISLTIKTAKGKSLPLTNVPPSCHVHELKALIESAHAIPKLAQRLIFNGRLLPDPKTIDALNITDRCAVHLVENTRAVAAASSSKTPAAPKPIVPPGTVCHVTNGGHQLNAVLQNCAKHRLVVVDWSAPWCGPCRMIAPVFERLASRFSDVTFVKVDTEASSENRQLTSESGIAGYPTFHFYINSKCVHSFSGANATLIENSVRKYRTQVSPSTSVPASSSAGASRSSVGPSPPGALTRNVLTALTTLKRHCTQQEFIVAVRTLLTFVRNVVNHPGEAKYCKVRTANQTFQTRLASKPGGSDAMRAFGFEQVNENGERFLVLPELAAANPELSTINTQLEQALAAAGGASEPQPSQTRATPNPPAGATTNRGFNPPAGLMDQIPPEMANAMGDSATQGLVNQMLADPNFMQTTQEIMADPTAMQRLAEAHRAMTTGDIGTLQRLQNDPSLMRLQNAMASNPAVMNEARRHLDTGLANMFSGMANPPMPGTGTPGQNAGAQPGPNQTPSNPPPPSYPGAPTTAEEEERLLQEAIRLSMQDANNDSNQQSQDQSKEQDSSKE